MKYHLLLTGPEKAWGLGFALHRHRPIYNPTDDKRTIAGVAVVFSDNMAAATTAEVAASERYSVPN